MEHKDQECVQSISQAIKGITTQIEKERWIKRKIKINSSREATPLTREAVFKGLQHFNLVFRSGDPLVHRLISSQVVLLTPVCTTHSFDTSHATCIKRPVPALVLLKHSIKLVKRQLQIVAVVLLDARELCLQRVLVCLALALHTYRLK